MAGKIILPKKSIDLKKYPNWPIFFFAGPDSGGGDWQVEMFASLENATADADIPNFLAAIPCRLTADHRLQQFAATSDFPDDPYQLGWERDWMRKAAWGPQPGCLLFWLACESETAPRTDGEPYARDSRREAGGWSAHIEHRPESRIALGGDTKFSGFKVIVRDFLYATGGKFSSFPSIEMTARHAVAVAMHGMDGVRYAFRPPHD